MPYGDALLHKMYGDEDLLFFKNVSLLEKVFLMPWRAVYKDLIRRTWTLWQ